MSIKVGFDYDEPIFPWYDYAHDASVAAGLTTREQEPPTRWDPHSQYGCTLEEWVEVLNIEVEKGDDGMYGRPLKPGIVDHIRRLYIAGFEIHIITARGQFGAHGELIKDITRRQMLREGLPYDSLHFVEDKVPVALELGLDYFIDDRVKYFEGLTAAGINCYLLDERWNRDVEVPKGKRLDTVKQYVDVIINQHGWDRKLTFTQRMHVVGER